MKNPVRNDGASQYAHQYIQGFTMQILPSNQQSPNILQRVRSTINRFCILDSGYDLVVAVWAIGTYLIRRYNEPQAFDQYPILRAASPDKESGKSTLRGVLEQLVINPKKTMSTTTAALFRLLDREQKTVLIDEFDTIMNKGGEAANDMTNILNAGWERGGTVDRCTGKEFTSTEFHTWGAKAIFGNGDIADTTASRCITLVLKKKLPTESVERLADAVRSEPEMFESLRAEIAQFCADHEEAIMAESANVPEDLGNRALDRWSPLFSIAQVFGSEVADELAEVASAIESIADDPPSAELTLLSLSKSAWSGSLAGRDRVTSGQLIEAINKLEPGLYLPARGGRSEAVTPRTYAARMRLFGVRPQQLGDGSHQRGYFRADFDDAFNRYLPDTQNKC
jgi:putative DNA primase/helicase